MKAKHMTKIKSPNRYKALIEKIFFDQYSRGTKYIEFKREDIPEAAKALGVKLPKNLGDVIYALRYRTELPDSILNTQPQNMEWVIEGAARSKYAFRLVKLSRILPQQNLVTIKIPDATPEIIRHYALNDEQALLAIVRYNRLLDIFLGVTTFSLQNHLRTTVSSGTQIEIDELYVGVDKHGCHYMIPVQAKGGKDQISVIQTRQDIRWCEEKAKGIRCRAVSAQFMEDDRIAMFELMVDDYEVLVVEERHYKLVPANALEAKLIRSYRE